MEYLPGQTNKKDDAFLALADRELNLGDLAPQVMPLILDDIRRYLDQGNPIKGAWGQLFHRDNKLSIQPGERIRLQNFDKREPDSKQNDRTGRQDGGQKG